MKEISKDPVKEPTPSKAINNVSPGVKPEKSCSEKSLKPPLHATPSSLQPLFTLLATEFVQPVGKVNP